MPEYTRFASFLKEKKLLQNVSHNTLRWYTHALKWLPSENPNDRELKEMVVRMREAGLKATGCNAAIRAINCYLHWVNVESGKCNAGCKHPRIAKLKEPEQIIATFSTEQVKLLLVFKPKTDFERRLHLLVMILLDTACRVSEALDVRAEDIDLDNLLLTLRGKGGKDRRVPISFLLRKALFKYLRDRKGRLFITQNGTPWGRLGALQSVKHHCRERLGFEPPPRTVHAMRHTAASNFVASGGSPFHLMKLLGHSTLTMSNRYGSRNVVLGACDGLLYNLYAHFYGYRMTAEERERESETVRNESKPKRRHKNASE